MPNHKTHEPDLQTLYAVIDAHLEALADVGQKLQERKDKEWLASIPAADTEELRKIWNMPRPQPALAQVAPIAPSRKNAVTMVIEQKRKRIGAQLQRLQAKLNGTD